MTFEWHQMSRVTDACVRVGCQRSVRARVKKGKEQASKEEGMTVMDRIQPREHFGLEMNGASLWWGFRVRVAVLVGLCLCVVTMGHAQAQEAETNDETSASSEGDAPADGAEELPPQPAADGQTAPDGSSGSSESVVPIGVPGKDRYDLKLRELEEKVIGLKERIFRTKTRLLLLKERILNDVVAEAKALIFHVNDMGGSFAPEQVLYHLDGEKIYFQDNTSGSLSTTDPLEIFSGNVMPGNHVLSVEMVYRGDSVMFPYLKDYLFRLRANYTFYATKGKVTQVASIGYQKGDITYDLTERPSIKFQVRQRNYNRENIEGGIDSNEDGVTVNGDD